MQLGQNVSCQTKRTRAGGTAKHITLKLTWWLTNYGYFCTACHALYNGRAQTTKSWADLPSRFPSYTLVLSLDPTERLS